jgi:hypothetical protein
MDQHLIIFKKKQKKTELLHSKISHVRSRQINILFFGSPRVLFKADKNFFFLPASPSAKAGIVSAPLRSFLRNT